MAEGTGKWSVHFGNNNGDNVFQCFDCVSFQLLILSRCNVTASALSDNMSSECSMAHEIERGQRLHTEAWMSQMVLFSCQPLGCTGYVSVCRDAAQPPEVGDPAEQVLQYHLPPPPPHTHTAMRASVSRDWSERICLFHARRMKPSHQLIRQWQSLCARVHECIPLQSFQYLIWLAGNHNHPSSSTVTQKHLV